MKLIIPDPKYYTLSKLAKKLECDVDDILHYGKTGQLKISVLSEGWYLEIGNYYEEGDDFNLDYLQDNFWVGSDKILSLYPNTIKEIISKGSVSNPQFVHHEENKFWGISSNLYPSHDFPTRIIIELKDLIVTQEDLLTFLNHSNLETGPLSNTTYISPYIQLMLRAISELKISKEDQRKVEELQEWFMNQEIDGHKITQNESKSLATFIRLPSSRIGGNKKFKQ